MEEAAPRKRSGRKPSRPPGPAPTRLGRVTPTREARLPTGLRELDRVLGGGLVPGSIALVGGEPGIGKSTLLLQCAAHLESQGGTTLYVSGEESPQQLKLRADRLDMDTSGVHVLGETRLESMIEQARALDAQILMVDSIQTTYSDELEGPPGSIGQVRECAARLMQCAKSDGPAVVLVGHVTKGGGIAGPKTLEHIVDTVLYFEGDASLGYRVLRSIKNRFGSVDEIGVFSMSGAGLVPVPDASAAFLEARTAGVAGSAVSAIMEGSRPLLVELQALTAKSGFGSAQRVATGLDQRRLALLLAVLERRAGLPFGDLDVFVNVTGGVRLTDPSTDLAVVAALVSSVLDRPVAPQDLFVGEVGLSGEVRPANALDRRAGEAARHGFRRVHASSRSRGRADDVTIVPLSSVADLVQRLRA